MNAREAREQAHALALSLESKRSSIVSLEQALGRMHGQLAQLDARKAELVAQLADDSDPLPELERERGAYLDQRLLVDKQLVEARRALEDCDGELRRLDGVAQILFQRRTVHDDPFHVRIKEADGVAAGILGTVHGEIRLFQ